MTRIAVALSFALTLAFTLQLAAPCLAADPAPSPASYAAWRHAGSLVIRTTPDAADLPADAAVEQFPLLVRLDAQWFDFAQAKPDGADIRFSSSAGEPLKFEIERWDPASGGAGGAEVWVRIPRITGNARQIVRMHWGNPDAAAESNPAAVFNESNGYVSVWHLGDAVRDAVGTLESTDTGTTLAPGVVGHARHLPGGKGVFGGDKIPNYPAGGAAHTTSLWFRAQATNATIIGWGNEGGGRGSKIRMILQSPPHLRVDSDFSDIRSDTRRPMNSWTHVVHTYGDGPRRLYINGKLDAEADTKLDIKSPARLWLGGWYHNYDFIGELDEVRIARVVRSAHWVRLEYANQNPLSTLVGPLITGEPAATSLSVDPPAATVPEAGRVTLRAAAPGAEKLYWSIVHAGGESRVAVDRFAFTYEAARVTADTPVTLRCKAVFADKAITKDIALTVTDSIPEPIVTLDAPASWDGRSTIELTPRIANLDAMRAAGAGELAFDWSVEPFAVVSAVEPGKLILRRALSSGPMTVTLRTTNGGDPVTRSVTIAVNPPARDAWVHRTPDADEKPDTGAFYPRDDANEGTLHCNGTLDAPADRVTLKVFADDQLFAEPTLKPGADLAYAFTVKLKPGLIKYRVELSAVAGDRVTVLHTADDIVCGDAYLVTGQSNAVATDWGRDEPPEFSSTWVRTFGSTSGSPNPDRGWGEATYRAPAGKLTIGYWPMELGRNLVDAHRVPVCFLNGAVGGTRIDQHQRNDHDPADTSTIYGRLLWRAQHARLTHGVRAIFWYQGENDQGADGPTGGYGYETYRHFFRQLAADWKTDYPNLQRYYVFQIWPRACSMGSNGSDNLLREVQRNLPSAVAGLSLMSVLGVDPPGECHFPPAGYAALARLIQPVVERDFYGVQPAAPVTPPNLIAAAFSDANRDAVTLEFDQPVVWDSALAANFYLDAAPAAISSARTDGNRLILRLAAPSTASTITYLDSLRWDRTKLLRGTNRLAALTFCQVPLTPPAPHPPKAGGP